MSPIATWPKKTHARFYLIDTLEHPNVVNVDASEMRQALAPNANCLSLALDTSETVKASNSVEKMYAHQIAVGHMLGMRFAAQLENGPRMDPVMSARTMAAAAMAFDVSQKAGLALHKYKTGGTQRVEVQYQQANVSGGGQAVVAGKVSTKRRRLVQRGEGRRNERSTPCPTAWMAEKQQPARRRPLRTSMWRSHAPPDRLSGAGDEEPALSDARRGKHRTKDGRGKGPEPSGELETWVLFSRGENPTCAGERVVPAVALVVGRLMVSTGSGAAYRRATAEEIRQEAIRGRLRGSTWATGWKLPTHRTHLRLLRQPTRGEQTSMLAFFEAADEVSAIVAAFGYFLWRQAPSWRECACGCGLTFITNGKQRYVERHQAAKWQRDFRRRRRARRKQQRV